MCGENFPESVYDWMRSLIREFFDVKPPWEIVYHDVFSSKKIIQVCCYPLQGRAEKDGGISGSLGVGWYLAQVWYRVINSPICAESPGHHTEVHALDLHLVITRWQVWLQTRICRCILLGITVWTSYRGLSLKSPETFRSLSGATIPFISSQRRGSKPSNFALLLIFLILKTCKKISFSKQADCSLTTSFSGPKSSRNFRETGPRSKSSG